MIKLLPPAAARDPNLVAVITELVNKVYDESEQGLWADGAARTSVAEVAGLIAAGEIVAAYLNGRLVGVVRTQHLDDETGEFGMLAADPTVRGQGIGRDLVRYA